ncbi:MAG: hypothetical protein KGZ97_03415 [Bacteroidetes bacterium]|nr:hypothetical protein [Bacteroidota bacterium]
MKKQLLFKSAISVLACLCLLLQQPVFGQTISDKESSAIADKSKPNNIAFGSKNLREISVDPDFFDENINSGEILEKTITLFNTGEFPMNYNISVFNSIGKKENIKTTPEPIEVVYDFKKGDEGNNFDYSKNTNKDGGPDQQDYFWKSATFDWINTSAGTPVTLSDDSYVLNIPLGFDFLYYGNNYSQINIMSNGYVSFTHYSTWYPNCVPSDGGSIMSFGRDLNPAAGGVVRHFTGGVAPNRHFVVEFNNVPRFGGTESVTFQVVFYETTNYITFNYLNVDMLPNALGIENIDGTAGMGNCAVGDLLIPSSIVVNESSLLFYTMPEWLIVNPNAGIVAENSQTDISIAFDATELVEGTYYGNIIIESELAGKSEIIVPVTLNVTGIPEITLSHEDIDFGITKIETEHSFQLGIFNPGTGTLEISEINIDSEYFYVMDTDMSIAPGSQAYLTVYFFSIEGGGFSSELEFTTNVIGSENIAIILSADIQFIMLH